MMMGQWYPLLVAALSVQHIHVKCSSFTFNNNKYDDILVAIHPDVKQDPRIIKEIITTFKLGSTYLYRATYNRAYFGRVKLLIPDTWQMDPSWSLATTETFEEADIRVDRPHVSHGSDPYTFQPGQCGESGKYIHFTPGYLTDEKGDRNVNYGNIGHTFVHEFAHLRYGVFDEYGLGTEEYPSVYLEDSELKPTACANTNWVGSYLGNCMINASTNKPDTSCFFVADREGNTARASIMYDASVDKVAHFCESNSDDPEYMHNSFAPNQQNKMCNGKGTWDVIKEHPDFKGSNSPVNKTSTQLQPSFSILYGKKTTTPTGTEVCGRPVVLVLDLSGSMNSNNRYYKQTQTADKLIRDILPIGTKVGVVTFSSTATERTPLTPLLTPSDRDKVAKSLPDVSKYTGMTGIGQGLLVAKGMLELAGETKEGRIVLITDGLENVEPYVAQVKEDLKHSGIRVHTVAYSAQAAPAISDLSHETGGQYAFFSESATSTILDSVIETLMKDIAICNHRVRIEIMRRATSLAANRGVVEDITIDSTVGNDTMFVFTLPNNVHVDVTLTSPDGKTYASGSSEYSVDKILNIVRFQFKRAQTGTWQYTLSATSSGTVTLVVKALPEDQADPYEVDSWLSSMFGDATYGSEPTVVYVHVHKGYSPVIGADVTVTVERPAPASPVTLKPLDNGILPDNMADDGVYSIYFTKFQGNERYSLDVEVNTIPGKTQFYINGPQQPGGSIARFRNTTTEVVAVPAENFTRTTSPGAMDIKGFVDGKDNFAPSRVTDLRVVAFDSEASTVTLTWTAPGDDLDTGNASRYDIRISQTSESFKHGFTNNLVKVEPNMILPGTGSLIPKPAGSKERMVVKTPTNWTTVVFALRTLDEANHVSDASNTAVATFKEVELKGQTTTTTTTTTTTSEHQEVTAMPTSDDSSTSPALIAAVVGSVLGAGVMVAASIIFAKFYVKKRVHMITNPFDAGMTEPNVPNVHYKV